MAGFLELIAWIYYSMTEPSWIPSRLHPFLHGVSGFFMTLGSLFIVPIIFLVIYDIILYVFRLTGSACQTLTNALQARQSAQPHPAKPPINGNGSVVNGHTESEKTE
ncbi:hypothetical protein B0T21DRAFT_409250 [Apiosordaria backusii]|uniref:Uncharacterized protein n=1 Tax=Apiosordaria backusii TaxID=314023 RepID=A0AA40K1E0_9PEZI|nr:hypothetical protein B0T21DRAFT_409250 [Apiosordaria backusii]